MQPGLSMTILAQRLPSQKNYAPQPNEVDALALWNRITIGSINVHSVLGFEVNPDCIDLGAQETEAECFSIQQNFWVSDSKGDPVFWAQNIVELAEFSKTVLATYAFVVWPPTEALQPLFCFPSSSADNVCQAPIYTYPVLLQDSFTFYAHISRVGSGYALNLSNDFAAQSWAIPTSIECPCFIDTVRQKSLPWGLYPFEFVAVGLDNGSNAFFGNGTIGNVSPGLVQLADGDWHLADMDTIHCDTSLRCLNTTSTMETSTNLMWENGTGRIYWSAGASDQGNYIAAIDAQVTEPPPIPHPVSENVLYIQMDLGEPAIPTLFDSEGRATGYDSSSGRFVQNIPNSFISSGNGVRIAIVNPNGCYRLTLSSVRSGPFSLVVSKESNVNGTEATRVLDGSISVLTSDQYVIDSNSMTLGLSVTYGPLLAVIEIALIWVAVVVGIGAWLKQRRSLKRSSEDDR